MPRAASAAGLESDSPVCDGFLAIGLFDVRAGHLGRLDLQSISERMSKKRPYSKFAASVLTSSSAGCSASVLAESSCSPAMEVSRALPDFFLFRFDFAMLRCCARW